jgi:hypothetical protein
VSDHTPKRKVPARRSCIFRTEFCRAQVDPRVQEQWLARTGKKAPFGDLRRTWVREHCVRVAPDQGLCPYPERDCALAFLAAVQTSLTARTNPAGYFRRVSKTMALDRLDAKPLSRDQEGPRAPDHVADGDAEGQWLRRATSRLVSIGDVLGTIDLGPRQGPTHDGKESTE